MKTFLLLLLLTFCSLVCFAQVRPDQINIIQTDAGAWNPTATSTYSASYPIQSAVNGDTTGFGWGDGFIYHGGWASGNAELFLSSTYTIHFSRGYMLKELVITGLKDDFTTNRQPAEGETTVYANQNFTVQDTFDGINWQTFAGGVFTNNHLVINHVALTDPAFSEGIRIVFNNGIGDGYARLIEVQAFAKNR